MWNTRGRSEALPPLQLRSKAGWCDRPRRRPGLFVGGVWAASGQPAAGRDLDPRPRPGPARRATPLPRAVRRRRCSCRARRPSPGTAAAPPPARPAREKAISGGDLAGRRARPRGRYDLTQGACPSLPTSRALSPRLPAAPPRSSPAAGG